jgi:hypothetical protein
VIEYDGPMTNPNSMVKVIEKELAKSQWKQVLNTTIGNAKNRIVMEQNGGKEEI